MKKKINILIITAIFSLLALSGIQAYLIYNTYQLKKDVFIKEIKKSVSNIDNTKEMDSLTELWYNQLTENLVEYKKNNILKKETIERFKPQTDSLRVLFRDYYRKEVAKLNLKYDLKYKKTIKSIVIFDNEIMDTIFSAANEGNYFLFGEDFSDEQGYVMSKGRWSTEHDYEDDLNNELIKTSLNLEIRTVDSVNIIDWKRIIFGQMTVLFVFSVLLFLFVVGLLFYSIKTLIQQKKIADVRTDFINNITHELKTPLATLAIASKSLRNKETQNSPKIFSNALDILDRQNNRLHKLIDQVMNNTLGSDEIVLQKEEVIDDKYFKEVIEDFRLAVKDQDVKVVSKIEFREIPLSIDKFLFTTALLNIMDNAVKYGEDHIEVVIRTKLSDEYYEISIHDNGIGIPHKEQRKIFEKFYRVTTGNVHNVKGLGLGLFYTNQIIKAHQGNIELESRPGLGTTFTITIPIISEI
ncbi:HAMP domain-containing sensor histidine kinase [Aquimarina sp. 2201CG5-10]|uniref:sensor histidine kinase n=1 Tax=Aquimarina callyspongiae TaxID=3098150 RepID=UPI002AB4CC91|nr:HAMP domain-containing sensor histidine kinase [Aquimarina sp. 2201CG5-10]MDY8136390.1 HAMP domain-containing sensor histidine kinase [Aquimarina sp. 2201CG5-10]